MLVAMLGMAMRASASSGRTAKVISASAIGGRTMPVPPLEGAATHSICVTEFAELYSGGVGEDLLHETRIGFTDQAPPVVGRASLPLVLVVILWPPGAAGKPLSPACLSPVGRRPPRIVCADRRFPSSPRASRRRWSDAHRASAAPPRARASGRRSAGPGRRCAARAAARAA